MKSQRRHALQHNTLDAELAKGLKFLKERGTQLAWGVLLVAVVIFAVVWFVSRSSSAKEAVRVEYRDTVALYLNRHLAKDQSKVTPQALLQAFEKLAGQDSVPRIAALSRVWVGDIHARRAFAAGPTDSTYEKYRAQARDSYEQAIRQFSDIPEAVARAHLGLAKLAESQRDLAGARKAYEKVIAMSGSAPAMLVTQAKSDLEKLDSYVAGVFPATVGAWAKPEEPVAGAPAAKPDTTSKPAPKPAVDPAPKPAPKPTPKPSTEPPAKPAPKPAPTPATNPAPKAAPKPSPKSTTKPASAKTAPE